MKLQKIGVLGQVGHVIFAFDNVDPHGIDLSALRFFEGFRLGWFSFRLKDIHTPHTGDFPEFAAPNFMMLLSFEQLEEEIHVNTIALHEPIYKVNAKCGLNGEESDHLLSKKRVSSLGL